MSSNRKIWFWNSFSVLIIMGPSLIFTNLLLDFSYLSALIMMLLFIITFKIYYLNPKEKKLTAIRFLFLKMEYQLDEYYVIEFQEKDKLGGLSSILLIPKNGKINSLGKRLFYETFYVLKRSPNKKLHSAIFSLSKEIGNWNYVIDRRELKQFFKNNFQ